MESIIEGKVKDMVDSNDNQAWNLSAHLLPQETLSHIASSYLRRGLGEDWLTTPLVPCVHLRSWLVSNIGSSANWRFNIPLWSSIFGMVCWKLWKSRNGFIFNGANFNCDGPVQSMVEKAAGGGLLRDENGTWILGYGRCFGERSVHGYKKVQVESDYLDMVNMVLHGSSDGFLLPIVADMRSLCLRDWTMVVQHISKEVNLIADCLV
ncbi:hypothetical protein V6Z11_D06G069100 [Gossypium hirsutum]